MTLRFLSFISSDRIKRHGEINVSRRIQIRAGAGIACVALVFLSMTPWTSRAVHAAAQPNAERLAKLCLPAGGLAFAGWRAPLCALPAEQ